MKFRRNPVATTTEVAPNCSTGMELAMAICTRQHEERDSGRRKEDGEDCRYLSFQYWTGSRG